MQISRSPHLPIKLLFTSQYQIIVERNKLIMLTFNDKKFNIKKEIIFKSDILDAIALNDIQLIYIIPNYRIITFDLGKQINSQSLLLKLKKSTFYQLTKINNNIFAISFYPFKIMIIQNSGTLSIIKRINTSMYGFPMKIFNENTFYCANKKSHYLIETKIHLLNTDKVKDILFIELIKFNNSTTIIFIQNSELQISITQLQNVQILVSKAPNQILRNINTKYQNYLIFFYDGQIGQLSQNFNKYEILIKQPIKEDIIDVSILEGTVDFSLLYLTATGLIFRYCKTEQKIFYTNDYQYNFFNGIVSICKFNRFLLAYAVQKQLHHSTLVELSENIIFKQKEIKYFNIKIDPSKIQKIGLLKDYIYYIDNFQLRIINLAKNIHFDIQKIKYCGNLDNQNFVLIDQNQKISILDFCLNQQEIHQLQEKSIFFVNYQSQLIIADQTNTIYLYLILNSPFSICKQDHIKINKSISSIALQIVNKDLILIVGFYKDLIQLFRLTNKIEKITQISQNLGVIQQAEIQEDENKYILYVISRKGQFYEIFLDKEFIYFQMNQLFELKLLTTFSILPEKLLFFKNLNDQFIYDIEKNQFNRIELDNQGQDIFRIQDIIQFFYINKKLYAIGSNFISETAYEKKEIIYKYHEKKLENIIKLKQIHYDKDYQCFILTAEKGIYIYQESKIKPDFCWEIQSGFKKIIYHDQIKYLMILLENEITMYKLKFVSQNGFKIIEPIHQGIVKIASCNTIEISHFLNRQLIFFGCDNIIKIYQKQKQVKNYNQEENENNQNRENNKKRFQEILDIPLENQKIIQMKIRERPTLNKFNLDILAIRGGLSLFNCKFENNKISIKNVFKIIQYDIQLIVQQITSLPYEQMQNLSDNCWLMFTKSCTYHFNIKQHSKISDYILKEKEYQINDIISQTIELYDKIIMIGVSGSIIIRDLHQQQ